MSSNKHNDEPGRTSPVRTTQLSKATTSTTPRRLRFTNLDEAHRKITSKSVPPSQIPQQAGEEQGNENQDNSSLDDQSVDATSTQSHHDFLPNPSYSSFGRSLTHIYGVPSAPELDMPSPRRERGMVVNALEQTVAEPKAGTPHNEPGTDQNPAHPAGLIEPPPRQGAATRCGFRGEDARNAYHPSFRAGSLSSGPPQMNLPDLPFRHRRSRSALPDINRVSSPTADTTVSDSQHLLNAEAQVNELQDARRRALTPPSRLPIWRDLRNVQVRTNDQYVNDTVSSFDATSGSNDDPFKYDEQDFQATLYPSKEREVSQALRRVSRVGEASEATMVTPEGSPYRQGQKVSGLNSRGVTALSRTKRPEAQIFDSSALQPAQTKKDEGINVRVVIKTPPKSQKGKEKCVNTKEPPKKLGPSENSLLGRLILRDSTADGTWVTEDASEFIKSTGSSIADFSDDDDEARPPSPSGSPTAILRHPAGKNKPESYELRTLKNTKQSVLLPKTRGLRLSAFPQNSMRRFSGGNKEGAGPSHFQRTSTRGQLNPFSRNDSYQNLDSEGNFPSKFARNGSSRYDFRDSLSDYDTSTQGDRVISGISLGGIEMATISEHSEGGDETIMPDPEPAAGQEAEASSAQNSQGKAQKYVPRLVDQDYPVRNGYWYKEEKNRHMASASQCSFNGEPITAQSKFGFDLISLEEAQRKNKEQRESGEQDETESAGTRYQRALSSSSSRALPSSSPVQQPKPVLDRRGPSYVAPNLSIDFSPSSCGSLREAFKDTPSPFSATSRPDLTPKSNKAMRPLILSRQNPFVTPRNKSTGLRQFLLGRNRSNTPAQRTSSLRNVSNGTVIRHPIANESGLSLAAMEAIMESSISARGRHRRRQWFHLVATMSIVFPFIAILFLTGHLNQPLIWYTKGEVRQVTTRQRNFIRNAFLFQCCLYVIAISVTVAITIRKH